MPGTATTHHLGRPRSVGQAIGEEKFGPVSERIITLNCRSDGEVRLRLGARRSF